MDEAIDVFCHSLLEVLLLLLLVPSNCQSRSVFRDASFFREVPANLR